MSDEISIKKLIVLVGIGLFALFALTSALVGFLYLAGSYEAIGNIEEGYLIIPAFERKRLEESGGV